jgi:RsgA GTPase
VNRLLGQDRQRTTAVREADSKGRHTTIQRELILMPAKWLFMDLPGLRELQLWADLEQIDNTFSEILELAKYCRFRDCTHQEEPGCAVRSAGVDQRRLESYHKLQRKLAFLEKQVDPHLGRETKKKWKVIEKISGVIPNECIDVVDFVRLPGVGHGRSREFRTTYSPGVIQTVCAFPPCLHGIPSSSSGGAVCSTHDCERSQGWLPGGSC